MSVPLSAGEYITTFYVMVDIVKGVGVTVHCAPLTLPMMDCTYARKWTLPLCVHILLGCNCEGSCSDRK